MGKIFIDTDVFPKAFRKLEPSLKLAWFYIWTHCDKSGVWEIDIDLYEFENRADFELEKFQDAFKSVIEVQPEKILLKDFIKVNYGTLTDNYNPHKPVFRDMAKNNVKLEPSLNQAYFKLVDEDVDEDKEEEEKKGKEGMGEKPKKSTKPKILEPEIILPFDSLNFKAQWELWIIHKQKQFSFKYKTTASQQAALNDLVNLSGGDEKTAIAIIHQSMAKGWKGFFELKNSSNEKGKSNSSQSRVQYSDDFKRKIADRLQPGKLS